MTVEGMAPIQLMAAASEVLLSEGYVRVAVNSEWDTPSSRLFEDPYSVVGVAVFDSCDDLLERWPDLQGSLVDILSQHVGRSDPKAWDGYLVLMTPSLAPSQAEALEDLRYNIHRIRKLVATGDEVRSPSDVRLVLSSLLPLKVGEGELTSTSALDVLPRLLSERGIDAEVTRTLVAAFRNQEPLIERLHERKADS